MYKRYALSLCVLLAGLFGMQETGSSQQQQFIIGGDWIKQPPVVDPCETDSSWNDRVPDGWWRAAKVAGLDCAFLYMSSSLSAAAYQQELHNAGLQGMNIALGHLEAGPAEDYKLFTAGRRWRFHPEDPGVFPPEGVIGTNASDGTAEQDASVFGVAFPNSRKAEQTTQGYICKGLTLNGDYFNPPQGTELHARIRMRVETATQAHAMQLVRVDVYEANVPVPVCGWTVTCGDLKHDPIHPEIPLSDDDVYGEVYIGNWIRGTGALDIRVQYLGNAAVYVDYIAIDDVVANELFQGDHDIAISDRASLALNHNEIAMLKTADEPASLEWPLVGYLNKRLSDAGVHTISWVANAFRDSVLRAVIETGHPQLAIDTYMLVQTPTMNQMGSVPGDSVYEYFVQNQGVKLIRNAAQSLRDYGLSIPLWDMVMISSWDDIREPLNSEIRMQVNLALTYGAKSIWYFLIHNADQNSCVGLFNSRWVDKDNNVHDSITARNSLERTFTRWGENKYACVQNINARLHQFGPTFLSLKWQDAISTHEWGVDGTSAGNLPRAPRFNLYNRIALADVISSDTVANVQDTIHRHQYVEVGSLLGPELTTGYRPEYLYVTNRRVIAAGKRNVDLEFSQAGGNNTYCIEDVYTGNIDVYNQNPLNSYRRYTHLLPPGEGMLLRVDTGRLVANRTLGDGQSMTVHGGAALRLDDMTLILNHGSVLNVEGYLDIGPQAHLVLNGGVVHCFNFGSLIFRNSDGLSGVGVIDHANLVFIGGLTVSNASSITLSGGSYIYGLSSLDLGDTLTFTGSEFINCGSPSPTPILTVNGTLLFTGRNQTYTFSGCLSSIIVGGTFECTEGVTLKNLPNLTGYGASTLHADGSGDHICRWQFRPSAECNAYGGLSATHTIFEGNPDSSARWAGILVAYDDARLLLDTCDVRDIRVTPSGAAIHLYDATSSENRIHNCHIYRATTDSIIRQGDGVFMQPYFDSGTMGTGSYARILCSTIDSSWWTGVAVVGSDAEIMHTTILGNRVGTSVGYLGQAVLHGDCIREHVGGCGAAVEDAHLMLGEMFNSNLQGENRIEENDTTQLFIGPSAYVETSPPGTNGSLQVLDVITHSNTAQQRIWMSPQAYPANLRETWWGVVPDSTTTEYFSSTQSTLFGMSSLPSGLLEYRPAFSYDPLGASGTSNCVGEDPIPSPVLRKGNGLPLHASSLEDLPLYARDNNFHEIYRFLTAWVQQSPFPDAAARGAGFALTLERMHERRFPDSAQVCLSRVSSFVQTCRVAVFTPYLLAALQAALAKAQLFFGDHAGAEMQFTQIRSQYPVSRAAREAVPYLLLLAMARRDSIAIENIVSIMVQSGYDSSALAQAYSMRRGYYRALPRAAVAKQRARALVVDTLSTANDPLHARCYPNPFNPSVSIAYVLPEDDHVTVNVHALDGRRIATLVDAWQNAGPQRVLYDAPNGLPSGVYFYSIITSTLHSDGRIQLIR